MPDIVLAADNNAATRLLHDAETMLGTLVRSGSGSLGPFRADWSASASFANGEVELLTPNIVRVKDCEIHYNLSFNFSVNLNDFLHFCIPQVCVELPVIGEVCTPEHCIDWPTVTIPISYSDVIKFTADFTLNPHLVGSTWLIDIVIAGIPNLQISPAAAAIISLLGIAIGAVISLIPFIGPFLGAAVAAIVVAIGIAGVTGLLGPILSLFVSGRTFTIYRRPRVFQVLPATLPLDPAVNIVLKSIGASVKKSDESELVIEVDITA